MDQFLNLPDEIQNEILKIYPETLIVAIRLSKKFSKQLKILLIEMQITSKEFSKYLETNPRASMIFLKSPSTDFYEFYNPVRYEYNNHAQTLIYLANAMDDWSITKIASTTNYNFKNQMQFCLRDQTSHIIGKPNHSASIEKYKSSISFDLLSTYRIIANRCKKSEQAKILVRKRFREVLKYYERLIVKNPLYRFDLYLYLIGHTWIFNINISVFSKAIDIMKNEQGQLILDIPEFEEIQKINEKLIFEISKRLEIIELLA